MEASLRTQAQGYLKAARGGWARPEKFTAESLFQLTALAIEGYWISWLEDRGAAGDHHGFRGLLKAAEKLTTVPEDLKKEVLALDQYQRLCDWIPIEPRKAARDEIPGLLDLATRVEAFTA